MTKIKVFVNHNDDANNNADNNAGGMAKVLRLSSHQTKKEKNKLWLGTFFLY